MTGYQLLVSFSKLNSTTDSFGRDLNCYTSHLPIHSDNHNDMRLFYQEIKVERIIGTLN